MADALGIDPGRVDLALDRLLELEIIALRPWRTGIRDGVWQILPIEKQRTPPRDGKTMPIAELLRSLGLAPGTDR